MVKKVVDMTEEEARFALASERAERFAKIETVMRDWSGGLDSSMSAHVDFLNEDLSYEELLLIEKVGEIARRVALARCEREMEGPFQPQVWSEIGEGEWIDLGDPCARKGLAIFRVNKSNFKVWQVVNRFGKIVA